MSIRTLKVSHFPSVMKTSISNRCFVNYFKVVASFGIFAIFLGVFYVVDSNNRMIKREILQMREELETRVQRSLRASFHEAKGTNLKRSKRGAADNDAEQPTLELSVGGVTYERWGRRDCSGQNNELLYHGIGAAAYYSHTGGVSNPLCLHLDVMYSPGRYVDGGNGASYIYGMEFRDSSWINPLFNLSLTESNTIKYHSVPCAICLAHARVSKVMIPGRHVCPSGWNTEYTGYIMAGAHGDKHSSEAICVDDTPQVVPGTTGSQNGAYLFMVETSCTSLLCEPFVNMRELSCVVCTK